VAVRVEAWYTADGSRLITLEQPDGGPPVLVVGTDESEPHERVELAGVVAERLIPLCLGELRREMRAEAPIPSASLYRKVAMLEAAGVLVSMVLGDADEPF